jgi:hypothetical protein
MRERPIDASRPTEDWEGNNVAVVCPVCTKVYITSGYLHEGRRSCPVCEQSEVIIEGGRNSDGTAILRWNWPGD